MAWIDYSKAHDSVPHSWILECLRLYNVHPQIHRRRKGGGGGLGVLEHPQLQDRDTLIEQSP